MLPILTLNNMMTYNDTLFDSIVLPDPAIDHAALVDTILDHFGEMQVMVPDWSMLRHSINTWFSAHGRQLARLWDSYIAEYDPVYNKDAYFEEERTPDISRTRTENRTTQRSSTGQDTFSTDRNTTTTGTDTGSSTGRSTANTVEKPGEISTESGSDTTQYKGFNSSTFNDVTKDLPGKVVTQSGTNTTDGTVDTSAGSTVTRSETQRVGGTDTTSSNQSSGGTDEAEITEVTGGSEKITRREYGNIGVTMASSMIRDSVKLWKAFNWYDVAAELWASDNLVMIY